MRNKLEGRYIGRRLLIECYVKPMAVPVALLALTVGCGVALAEGTVGDLSRIQTETLLLKAKVSRASAQAELDAKSRGGPTGGSDTEAPVVKNVYGVGGKMAATFLYGSGVVVDGRAGDAIPGGFKVVSVSIDKIELSKGGKTFQIGFSATPPVQAAPTGTPGGPAGFPPVVR